MKESTNTGNSFLKNAYAAIVVLLIAAFVGTAIYIGVSSFMNHY